MAGFAGSETEVAVHRFSDPVVEPGTPVEPNYSVESSTSVEPDTCSESPAFVEANRERGGEAVLG
jgi:hypothetical protein